MRPCARAEFATFFQVGKPTVRQRNVERMRIVAGIKQGATGGPVGKCLGVHQVATDHLDRIELELDRDSLHQSFERVIHLRAAEAAVQSGRCFIGQHNAISYRDMSDVIGAGEIAVHPVECCRLGRADMGADVFDLVIAECAHTAVSIDRRFELRHAIGR